MQTHSLHLKIGFLCAFFLALSGCSGNVKKQLGLAKEAPDEFRVVKRAPLEMPPDLSLPPPAPGAARPQEAAPVQQAEKAVFGESQERPETAESTGEAALLQKAGATHIDPSIRKTVDVETAEMSDRNKPVVKKLLDIGKDDAEPSASVVDPKAEYERIRKNREESKPITEGETPTIEE